MDTKRSWATAAATIAVALVVLLVGDACSGPATPLPTPTPVATLVTPTPTPTLEPLALHGDNPVVGTTTWWSWSLLDRRTGEFWGSENQEEGSRTASMVKAWLAALYLREHPQPTQSWLRLLSTMIRDSDNAAADTTYRTLGSRPAVTDAMQEICGVTASIPAGHTWAATTISSRQQALLGDCIADGRVAAAEWTAWLLNEMRNVRGGGDFGIKQAFPEDERAEIAVKNGWTSGWGNGWWINCMGVTDDWVLVIETRSPSFGAGTNGCVSITQQLLAPSAA